MTGLRGSASPAPVLIRGVRAITWAGVRILIAAVVLSLAGWAS
jgi:cytosine/uracil/thiamine/allantoin permease